MAPCLIIAMDMRQRTLDYKKLRRLTGQLQRVAPFYLDDYYPLTPYSLEPNVWMAWQFDRPETGEGVVQAFRRKEAKEASVKFPLQGLDPKGKYEVENLD
ncbi:MAG: GH36 C-terminal domain-containing protein, partial [Verrucomicrobiota bacterium]